MSEADLGFAVRHGLAPQLYRNVPQLRPRLEDRLQQNLKRSLLLTAELSRLLDALPAAVPFKGPVLAQRLYGDVAGREYCDLDLLLRPADIPAAITALERMGYAAALPLEPWQLQRQLHDGCEYAMSQGAAHVELHWQFAPRQFGSVFDIEQLMARSITLPLGGRMVPALSHDDELLMLVVHATKHAWNKLAYLADIAALLLSAPLDWDYLRGEALDRRTGLAFCAALVLADWFHAPVPREVLAVAAADTDSVSLAGQVKKNFENDVDLEAALAARHRFVMDSRDTIPERIAYLLRYALTPTLDDWDFLRLPARFRWLYPAVRVLRLATRRT